MSGIYGPGEYAPLTVHYTAAGVGKTGLTDLTYTLYDATGVYDYAGQTGQSLPPVTELGGGLYRVQLDTNYLNDKTLTVLFHTEDGTVDQKDLTDSIQVPNWVAALGNLAGDTVSALRFSNFPIDNQGTFRQYQSLLKEIYQATVNGSGGGGGGGGSDPLASIVPGAYPPDTAGYALGRVLLSTSILVDTTGPVDANGNVKIRRGDAYAAAENRALVWVFRGLPPGLNFVGSTTYLNYGRGATVVRKALSVPTYDSANRTLTVTAELTGTETTTLDGDYQVDIETDFGDGDPVTWGQTYTMSVTRDVR